MEAETNSRITNLVALAKRLQAELKEQQAHADQTERDLKDVTDRQLPAVLDELGMSDATLADGTRVSIQRIVQAHISEANQAAAYKWLADNGLGDLVKERTTISVHPSSLKALVRERLELGQDVPSELFGVFQFITTKIGQGGSDGT
jgi:ABC-type transporter MlaC component